MTRNYLFNAFLTICALLTLSACETGFSGKTPWDGPVNNAPVRQGDITTPAAAPQDNAVIQVPDAPSSLGPVKVAILLPLSGQSEQTGQALLNAAQLALFDLKAGNDFELMPKDTKGNSETARIESEAAVKDGAKLILGPLFSAEAKPVSAVALQNNINAISFSTDMHAASGNGFVMGFLPQTQIERVIAYAQSKGLSRIALIAPRDAYGDMSAEIFDRALRTRNLSNAGILRFTGTTPTADALKNFVSAKPVGPYGTSSGVMDGVLIATPPESAARISGLMTNYGAPVSNVRRLGTGLWDQSNSAKYTELSGAWFASSAPATRTRFETQYQSTYGTAPPRIASLAYDATALAIVLHRTGTGYTRNALQNQAGFAGIDGVFRFNMNGVVERQLAVMEITPAGMTIIQPAATNF